MKKRLFSLLLVCFLLCSLLPVGALAEGDLQPQTAPDGPVAAGESTPEPGTDDPGVTHRTTERRQEAVADKDADPSRLFEGFVAQHMGKTAPKGDEKISGAGNGLTGGWASAYSVVFPEIRKIAVGERASTQFVIHLAEEGTGETILWTAEDLGVESVLDGKNLCNAFWAELRDAMLLFYCALRADNPFDMYWHDVTSGFYYMEDYVTADDGSWVEITALYFGLSVDPLFQDGGDKWTVNTAIGQAVITAGDNARAIVDRYKSVSDYEKLRGYRREICDLVEYDYGSLEAYNAGTLVYSGAWQVVWVFDGDDDTNVVCEGYAKAFQHLCDLTNFTGDIRSIIVSGNAGGAHMWNVVQMEDGARYLVDVTWSDGSPDESYFLKGADGGAYPGYQFYGGWRYYDAHTRGLYTVEQLSLSTQDYTPGTLAITAQPQDVSVGNGEEAVFTVLASGRNLSFQWYERAPQTEDWTLLEGAVRANLTLVASAANNGRQYRCLVRDDTGELFSEAATLTVVPRPPVIVAQPQDVTVDNGREACFAVRASGKTVRYQWYGMPPEEDWVLLEGAVESRLTLLASASNNGWQYRCVLQNDDGEVVSDAATLTVMFHPPVVVTQPKDAWVKSGKTAKFTVKAKGAGVVCQWYVCGSEDEAWTALENETGTTLTVLGTRDNNGFRYFCRFSNDDGYADSDAATLHVELQLPVIKTQPKDATVKSGSKAKFSVKVSGKNLTYTWFERASAADEWIEMAGEVKNTINVVASLAKDGSQYYCRISNPDGEAESREATLHVTPQPPVIKRQPKSVTVKSGSKAKLSVKASGPNLRYQWFRRASGTEDWVEMAGQDKEVCTFTAWLAEEGDAFFCRVWNDDDTLDSDAAVLHVTPQPLTIKTQPKDVTVKSGAKAKFKVKADGPDARYQWYSRDSEDDAWVEIEGATKAEYAFTAPITKNGSQYYCRVYNDEGSLNTAEVTLHVTPQPPKFSTQPRDAKVKPGAEAKFKAKASGKNVTYQWYFRTSEESEWVLMDGETDTILLLVASEDNFGWQFRCRAVNEDGSTYSRVASLLQK